LNAAYLNLEKTIGDELPNIINPPSPPAAFTLFVEERIRNSIQKLINLNKNTVGTKLQGYLDDIKKTVFN
jgi:hypothetical protein